MIWPTISGKSYVDETVKSMTTGELGELRRVGKHPRRIVGVTVRREKRCTSAAGAIPARELRGGVEAVAGVLPPP
jgi:hypothetical protein